MSNQQDRNDLTELALDYAVGNLSAAESDAFAQRLQNGDPQYCAAFGSIESVAAALLALPAPVTPSLITRSNLINSVFGAAPVPPFSKAPAPDAFAEDAAGMVSLQSETMDWKDTGVPGVKERRLYVDKERKRISLLLRLEPGVVFPDHDHPDVEECIVLEGDLELGGITLRKHDYMRIPKGGRHGSPRTVNGCLLLVTCGYTEAA